MIQNLVSSLFLFQLNIPLNLYIICCYFLHEAPNKKSVLQFVPSNKVFFCLFGFLIARGNNWLQSVVSLLCVHSTASSGQERCQCCECGPQAEAGRHPDRDAHQRIRGSPKHHGCFTTSTQKYSHALELFHILSYYNHYLDFI